MPIGLRPLKVTVVGDGAVGKSCLLITYTRNEFPEEYIPTVFDNLASNMTIDGIEYNMMLWDTAGQEHYDRLRTLSYPNTNCFIVCYSITNRDSFKNIKCKWLPEIRHFANNVPVVLVGTKLDMRIPNSEKFVTTQEGRKMHVEIRAHSFIECSAKKRTNLHQVFEEAVRAVQKPRKRLLTCQLL